MAQSIVTAKLMADIALEFNIGADILSKGNRTIEKYLGADRKSGDTVYVPIVDSGQVFEDFDLTSPQSDGKLTVDRDEIAVQVKPLTTAAQIGQEDLTLAIKNPELISKRVAKLADTASIKAYDTLVSASQAFVASSSDADAIRIAAFDAEANTVSSKLGGSTYGVTHPFAWNRVVSALQANFAPNDRRGNDLYRNELGDFLGFTWSKATPRSSVTASANEIPKGDITLTSGSDTFNETGPSKVNGIDTTSLPAGTYYSQPFTLKDVYNVDSLGNKTNDLKTFYLKGVVTEGDENGTTVAWSFAVVPVFAYGQGGLNCYIDGITNDPEGKTTKAGLAVTAVLTAGTTYATPPVMFKQNDFLVAVKGLEPFYGCDSFTIPTVYRDRGILPLRGTAFTDPISASTIFRVDVLLGMAVYTGLSISSVYIPISTAATTTTTE